MFDDLNPPYTTIVADPPWDHSDGTGRNYGERDTRGTGRGVDHHTTLTYSVMSVDDIAALPVSELAAKDAHLYLWTTNRFLRDAYDIAAGWGFKVSKPLIWCKEPMGFFGPPYVSSAEFCLFARRGTLKAISRADRQWWVFPRGPHSVKPAGLMDIVEQVSPGPYLELFARQPRLGWDAWGRGYEAVA